MFTLNTSLLVVGFPVIGACPHASLVAHRGDIEGLPWRTFFGEMAGVSNTVSPVLFDLGTTMRYDESEMSIYVELTDAFNRGQLRAVLSSGQAVVFHQLAVMSKDGDWILREDREALEYVLGDLARREAHYRFGAPLDPRWMRGGWSAHFEFRAGPLRVRTDFVTRPPRLSPETLAALWQQQEGRSFPVVGVRDLCELKKTNREKDYAVIGELARRLESPRDQLQFSRSARDLFLLAKQHPGLVDELIAERPLLRTIAQGVEALESALDAERRRLMHANEARLQTYLDAATPWRNAWLEVEAETAGLPLDAAHRHIVRRAETLLPFVPSGETAP